MNVIDAQPPEYTLHTPPPNTEKRPVSAGIITPQQSMSLNENSSSQPTSKPEPKPEVEQRQTWSQLEADPLPSIQIEWEPEFSHVAQNWNPSTIPRSLVPGSWDTAGVDTPRDWNLSATSPPLFFPTSWESINSHPAQQNQPALISQHTTSSRDWLPNYFSSPETNNPSIRSSDPTTTRGCEFPAIYDPHTWDATPFRGAESIVSKSPSSLNSSAMQPSISSPQWGTDCRRPTQTCNPPPIPPKEAIVPVIIPPQFTDRPREWEKSAVSPPQVWTTGSIPAPFTYTELESEMSNLTQTGTSSTVSSPSDMPRSHVVSTFNVSSNFIKSLPSGTFEGRGSDHSAYNETQGYELLEDEDPEVAFYRDLRRQEEERRQRRAVRMDTT
jgi:hypothetical protein